MDFGTPKASENTDLGKLKKLAQRVEQVLNDKVVFKEPKQLDPRQILVAPLNRDGAPPNVQYIHHGIIKNILQKGFDRTRPQVGICVEFKSDEAKAKLLEHNRRFSKGVTLLPPIDESKVLYGSLAGSHLNLALRLIRGGCSSPVGDLNSLIVDDESLKEVVLHGHRWWILPEDTPSSAQVDISLWRNQDQNDNQGIHEIEILQTIMATAKMISETNKNITMGDLIARASKRNPAKISPRILQTLAKFFTQFLGSGDQHLVNELIDYHSHKVNPRELVVNNAFFEALTNEEALRGASLLRHYLLLTQYTCEKTRAQAGSAAVSVLLEPANIVALVKKGEFVTTVENKLRELRTQYLPILEKSIGGKQARLELSVLMDLVIRCLLAKPWPEPLQMKKMTIGKFSNEKLRALAIIWGRYIDNHYPDLNFALEAQLLPEKEDDEAEKEEVDLQLMRTLKKTISDPSSSGSSSFKRGDLVTVVRRMSWTVPRANKKDYRKDVAEGTEGIIEGWADLEQRQVLLKVTLELPDGPTEVVHQVFPRNLQLTSE